jgi:hypothetical protein
MGTATTSRATDTPRHLWLVGGLALLWNAFGAFDYLMTHLRADFYMSGFSPEQLEYFYGFPSWAVAFWAIGVWCSFAGSAALLLRSRFAVHLFALSVVGLIGTTVYTNLLSDGAAVMDGMGYVVMSVVIWVVLLALLAYSVAMRRRGVLR